MNSIAYCTQSRADDRFTHQQQFLLLMPSRDAYIAKSTDNWKKKNEKLLDQDVLDAITIRQQKAFLGCYWGKQTRHAVLDIDQNSQYHNSAALQKLQTLFAAVGLSVQAYQSSDSGGWHLYLFFSEWQSADEVQRTLKLWLKRLGYCLLSGQLEVFPSRNALRLPLQSGFGWLDLNGNVTCKRDEMSATAALVAFLHDVEENQQDWPRAKRLMDTQSRLTSRHAGSDVQVHENVVDLAGFESLWKSGQIHEQIEEARKFLDHGLTKEGQRHAAIYSIQHLLWFGDAERGIPRMPGTHNSRRRQEFLINWLSQNHNGKCRHVNKSNWRLLEEHIRRACDWQSVEPPAQEFVPYMTTERQQERLISLTKNTRHLWTPADLERANQKRETNAREKIRNAVELLQNQERRVTGRQIMRLTNCSYHTVRKHVDLWQFEPALLSSGAGDIDPGVGVSSAIEPDCFDPVPSFEASVVAFQVSPAASLTSNSRMQVQALRVSLKDMHSGPEFNVIPAEGHAWKGEILLLRLRGWRGPPQTWF